MIKFHEKYKALKGITGYIWNTEDECLYSMKPSGELRKMKIYYSNRFMKNVINGLPYYQLSIKGFRKYLFVDRIPKLILDECIIE